jgi:hypothetical protein
LILSVALKGAATDIRLSQKPLRVDIELTTKIKEQ